MRHTNSSTVPWARRCEKGQVPRLDPSTLERLAERLVGPLARGVTEGHAELLSDASSGRLVYGQQDAESDRQIIVHAGTVSYTHLTLPTSALG